jgi:hypothetical protein
MELDLSQLDELDLEEGLEVDLDEQESDLERRGGGSKKERSQYYPGRGRSYVRLLSVLVMGDDGKPSIKIFLKVETHTAKKTGLKDDKGRKVNLACFPGCHVCGRRQKTGKVLEKIIGKDNAWKGDLIKSLFPEEHHWGVVQLLEDSGTCQTCHDIESLRTNCTDCGGSGWKDSKRQKKEGYVNGHLYQARFEFGKPKMYQKPIQRESSRSAPRGESCNRGRAGQLARECSLARDQPKAHGPRNVTDRRDGIAPGKCQNSHPCG